jgi:hypothetical protein
MFDTSTDHRSHRSYPMPTLPTNRATRYRVTLFPVERDTPDLSLAPIEPDNIREHDAAPSLQDLQALIGGYITRVPIRASAYQRELTANRLIDLNADPTILIGLFVDEDGLPRGLPFNRRLTDYAAQVLYGPGVLVLPIREPR